MLKWGVNDDLLGNVLPHQRLGALPRLAPDLKIWLAWQMRELA
jgi:hypothetical protein